METLKLIFLDFDGVLNSQSFRYKQIEELKNNISDKDASITEFRRAAFDSSAVSRIVNICKTTGAKIVVTSSWRLSTLEDTLAYLNEYNSIKELCNYIVGITPWKGNCIRGEEIEWFLKHMTYPPISPWKEFYDYDFFKFCKHKEIKYCIVDDDSDMLSEQMDCFLKTDHMVGLTDADAEEIIRMLN